MMSVVTYGIAEAKGFGHRRLFDQPVQDQLGVKDLERHNIYIFSISQKVRYNLDNCFPLHHDVISVQLKAGSSLSSQFLFVLYHHWKPFSEYFRTERDFDSAFESLEMDYANTTESILAFKLTFRGHSAVDFRIPIDLFLTVLDIEFGDHPKVVYIGQTFRLNQRFNTHEQLNRIASKLRDNEELRINLLTFKFGFGGIPDSSKPNFDFMWDFVLDKQHHQSREYKTKISLLERCLIHFFKPEYNTQHVNTPVEKDRLICSVLRTHEVRGVIVGIGMKGYQWQFWSPKQAVKTNDSGIISYDFHNAEGGFTAGVNPILLKQ